MDIKDDTRTIMTETSELGVDAELRDELTAVFAEGLQRVLHQRSSTLEGLEKEVVSELT